MLFLDAPVETGKTCIINVIQNCLNVLRKKVIAVVSFTVEAKLLKGGRTAHSAFKIPVSCGEDDTCYISVNSGDDHKLQGVFLIICDKL